MARKIGDSDISEERKLIAINLKKIGFSYRNIGEFLGINYSSISKWCKHGIKNKKKGKKISNERLIIKKQVIEYAKYDPFLTSEDIRKLLPSKIPSRTIRFYLCSAGLSSHRAAKVQKLSEINQYGRYSFGLDHLDWDESDWSKVVFSDEKTFVVGHHGVVYVRRPENERFTPEYVCPNTAHTKFSINVWGCISIKGCVLIENVGKNFNSVKYLDLISNSALPKLLEMFGNDFIFQQDNARIHTAMYEAARIEREQF